MGCGAFFTVAGHTRLYTWDRCVYPVARPVPRSPPSRRIVYSRSRAGALPLPQLPDGSCVTRVLAGRPPRVAPTHRAAGEQGTTRGCQFFTESEVGCWYSKGANDGYRLPWPAYPDSGSKDPLLRAVRPVDGSAASLEARLSCNPP